MNVILVEPAFPYNQREFARGLAAAGARVIGIGERPVSHLDPELAGWLAHYEQVSSVVNEPAASAPSSLTTESIQTSGFGSHLSFTVTFSSYEARVAHEQKLATMQQESAAALRERDQSAHGLNAVNLEQKQQLENALRERDQAVADRESAGAKVTPVVAAQREQIA